MNKKTLEFLKGKEKQVREGDEIQNDLDTMERVKINLEEVEEVEEGLGEVGAVGLEVLDKLDKEWDNEETEEANEEDLEWANEDEGIEWDDEDSFEELEWGENSFEEIDLDIFEEDEDKLLWGEDESLETSLGDITEEGIDDNSLWGEEESLEINLGDITEEGLDTWGTGEDEFEVIEDEVEVIEEDNIILEVNKKEVENLESEVSKDGFEGVVEDEEISEEEIKGCVYSKDMSIPEFLRANPKKNSRDYVEYFYSKEDIEKALERGQVLRKKGIYII